MTICLLVIFLFPSFPLSPSPLPSPPLPLLPQRYAKRRDLSKTTTPPSLVLLHTSPECAVHPKDKATDLHMFVAEALSSRALPRAGALHSSQKYWQLLYLWICPPKPSICLPESSIVIWNGESQLHLRSAHLLDLVCPRCSWFRATWHTQLTGVQASKYVDTRILHHHWAILYLLCTR